MKEGEVWDGEHGRRGRTRGGQEREGKKEEREPNACSSMHVPTKLYLGVEMITVTCICCC